MRPAHPAAVAVMGVAVLVSLSSCALTGSPRHRTGTGGNLIGERPSTSMSVLPDTAVAVFRTDAGYSLTDPSTTVSAANVGAGPVDVALRVLRLSEAMAGAQPEAAAAMMAMVAAPSMRAVLAAKAKADAADTLARYGKGGVGLRVTALALRRTDRPDGRVEVSVWFVGVLRFDGGKAGATWRTSTFTLEKDPINGTWGLLTVATRPGPTPPPLDTGPVGSAAQLDAELVGFTFLDPTAT